MDIGQIFLDILTVVSDSITELLGMLPNPDPFPEILEDMDLSSDDAGVQAYFWLNQFVDIPAVVAILAAWFTMFAIGWIIMMLWKWIKAR